MVGVETLLTGTVLTHLLHSPPARRLAHFLSVALCASLGGCSLGPRYHRPDITLPGSWRSDPTATQQEADAAAAATVAIAHGSSSSQTAAASTGSTAASNSKSQLGTTAIAADNPALNSPEAPPSASVGATAAWPSADWWHSFGSVQLDDFTQAASTNPTKTHAKHHRRATHRSRRAGSRRRRRPAFTG